MAWRSFIALTGVALLLTGCGDPKAASESNFEAALQAWHDAHPVCVVLPVAFPHELRVTGREVQRRRFDALAEAGLLSVESFRKAETNLRGGTIEADYLRYRMTDTGAAAFRVPNPRVANTHLCFARKTVTGVRSFTPPADALGIRTTRVTYGWKLDDIAPWTSSPSVRAAWPLVASTLDKASGEATDMLVETADGWRHERAPR